MFTWRTCNTKLVSLPDFLWRKKRKLEEIEIRNSFSDVLFIFNQSCWQYLTNVCDNHGTAHWWLGSHVPEAVLHCSDYGECALARQLTWKELLHPLAKYKSNAFISRKRHQLVNSNWKLFYLMWEIFTRIEFSCCYWTNIAMEKVSNTSEFESHLLVQDFQEEKKNHCFKNYNEFKATFSYWKILFLYFYNLTYKLP